MDGIIVSALCGLLGGAVRAIVGWRKERKYVKGAPWRWSKARFTLVTSAVIGLFAAMLLNENLKFALAAGYMGTDFIEGMINSQSGKQKKK